MHKVFADQLSYASYYAPRGRERLQRLGQQISQRYVTPDDNLIGILGESGSGKSAIIRGMFPGLELTNDDEGVNIRPLPILKTADRGFFSSHTYHIDMRFELAFTQLYELADAVKSALDKGKRVVVEHFDLLYPQLGRNADVLVGIGDEVNLVRPNVFGPFPEDVLRRACMTLPYRKMAHTAEELVANYLETKYELDFEGRHRDVHHGFILELDQELNIDFDELENWVQKAIAAALPVGFKDDGHISIGGKDYRCSAPRNHVKNTSEIENFHLVRKLTLDPKTGTYLIIGRVGMDQKYLDGFFHDNS